MLSNERISAKTKLLAVAVIVVCVLGLSLLSGCVPFGASTSGTHDAWIGNPPPVSSVDVHNNRTVVISTDELENNYEEFEK